MRKDVQGKPAVAFGNEFAWFQRGSRSLRPIRFPAEAMANAGDVAGLYPFCNLTSPTLTNNALLVEPPAVVQPGLL